MGRLTRSSDLRQTLKRCSVLGRSLGELLFVQGQATHFVQDLNQPLHAAWGETRAEHNEVEAQMLYRSWQKDHAYRGFMLELLVLRI